MLNGDDPVEYPPSGTIVRLKEKTISTEQLDGVKLKTVEYDVDGKESWPQPRPNTLFIVSYMIANSAKERDDLVFPFDLVRKPGGVIIGCRSFAKIAKS